MRTYMHTHMTFSTTLVAPQVYIYITHIYVYTCSFIEYIHIYIYIFTCTHACIHT